MLHSKIWKKEYLEEDVIEDLTDTETIKNKRNAEAPTLINICT
ncbi:hypothetical protein T08_6046 [Trichinella sp. T8]|nr:hypothetical protein T08_6046 [Trichinella sp. T8]